MSEFLAAAALIDQLPNPGSRRELFDAFVSAGLPTPDDEVWRYAPLGALDLDSYFQQGPISSAPVVPASILEGASAIVSVADGRITDRGAPVEGVTVSECPTGGPLDGVKATERYGADSIALLSLSLSPSQVTIEVSPGIDLSAPIVITHQVRERAVFPTTRIVVGAGSRVEVLEVLVGGEASFVAPVSEFEVGEGSRLEVSSLQRLAPSAWHVARSTAIIAGNGVVRQSVVGLGGLYDRCRNDAEFTGSGASNELRTTYFGSDHQVHDLRTHQLHRAARTTSTLLSKGVVGDESRSIYTGLIEIERGAKRTDARQTNHNLILSPKAHADTVPNLDIRENDVACAHASSVGPLDEMQLWYIESRGVTREVAKRLLVLGFFNEMTTHMPVSVAALVNDDVAKSLSRMEAAT
jgi:Fe-S cluster assembly protein SufD